MRWLVSHLKAHALIFDSTPRSIYPPAAGTRLLAIFLIIEILLGPRLALLTALGVPEVPMWVRVPVMLGATLVLVRFAAGVPLSQIGLYGWRHWTPSEKSYVVNMVPLAVGIFTFISIGRLRTLVDSMKLMEWPAGLSVPLILLAYLIWGFYQELMYRGILQTELTRRWGVRTGMFASNTAYAFGPLHFYYWSAYSGTQALAMFGAVFAIGLYFALLFQRSGNLWLPGILHGIGDVFLTGLRRLA